MEDDPTSRPTNLAVAMVFALAAGYGAHLVICSDPVGACQPVIGLSNARSLQMAPVKVSDCLRDGVNACRVLLAGSEDAPN